MEGLTNRQALAVKLADKADKAGGGGGWVYVKDVVAWSKTDGWVEEAKRLGVPITHNGWYSGVLQELAGAGYLQRVGYGKYKKVGDWEKLLQWAERAPVERAKRKSPIVAPRWNDARWLAAEIVEAWPKRTGMPVKGIKRVAAERGGDAEAVGRALADFCGAYGALRRVRQGVYEKTGDWARVTRVLKMRGKGKKPAPKASDESWAKIMDELTGGYSEEVEREIYGDERVMTPPTLPGFVSVKAPSVELVDTPIGPRPPTIITIDDLITHAEGLARQVVEWHGKYQQAVVMLRNKEADVEAAMRMLSEMEEQVMRKNAELEEAKGELITLQKQYEVAMDRARRAPIIPMINSKVTEDMGLTDEDKTPPTNGGGAAA